MKNINIIFRVTKVDNDSGGSDIALIFRKWEIKKSLGSESSRVG